MGKTYRYESDDESELLTDALDMAAADLMRAELELGGSATPGGQFYVITDHLGSVLDSIESQPGNEQAEADAERQAVWNAAQALEKLIAECHPDALGRALQ